MASPAVATFDSQLMDNYIATSKLPPVKDIAAVYDENHNPILFFVDRATSTFSLVYHDNLSGHSVAPANLTQMLGFQGEVKSICASQHQQSLQIFLALAVEAAPGSSLCNLLVFAPGYPQDFKDGFKNRLLRTTEETLLKISSLSMTTAVDDSAYPYIAAQVLDEVSTVRAVRVDVVAKSWSWAASGCLPSEATIVDTKWATLYGQPGMWVLYQEATDDGKPAAFIISLYYSVDGAVRRKSVVTPDGVGQLSSLAVIMNYGIDELFVLGAGLHYFDRSSLALEHSVSRCLSRNTMFEKTSQASASQTRTLTTDHQAGKYVALAAPVEHKPHDQHVIYVSQSGDVKLVVQSPSGAWSIPAPFTVPDPSGLMVQRTYTTHIALPDIAAKGDFHTVAITASDTASVLINGCRYTISPSTPVEMSVPPRGSLFIVSETVDYTAPVLTVRHSNSAPSLDIDPTVGTGVKLTALDTKEKLRNVINSHQGGARDVSVQGRKPTDEELASAAQVLQGLALRGRELDATGTDALVTRTKEVGIPAVKPRGKPFVQVSSVELSALPLSEGLADELLKDHSNITHVLSWASHEILTFSHAAGDAIRSVGVKIGNEIRRFFIMDHHDIVEVAQFVLRGIGVVWEHIKALVGVEFDWTAILKVQTEFHKGVSAAIECGRGIFEGAASVVIQNIDTFFEQQEAQLSDLDTAANHCENVAVGMPQASDTSLSKLLRSAKLSVIHAALSYGGISTKQTAATPRAPAPAPAKAPDTLQTLLATTENDPHSEKLRTAFLSLGEDFIKAATPPVNTHKIIHLSKTIILIILNTIQLFTHDLLTLLTPNLNDPITLANAQISIPIITPLMHLLSDGRSDGTTAAMEVVSFLMAVVSVEMVGMGVLPRIPGGFDIVGAFPLMGEAERWGVMDAVDGEGIEAQARKYDSWQFVDHTGPNDSRKAYARLCSQYHPAVSFLHTILTSTTLLSAAHIPHLPHSPSSKAPNSASLQPPHPSLPPTPNLNSAPFDHIAVALGLVNLTLSCPPYAVLPGRDALFTGYTLTGFREVDPNKPTEKLFYAVLDFGFDIGSITFYASALEIQLKSAEAESDKSVAAQQDVDMTKLAMVSLGARAVEAVGRLVRGVGEFGESEGGGVVGVDAEELKLGGAVGGMVGAMAGLVGDLGRARREWEEGRGRYWGI
ncbi:hypothetical protein MMC30_005308 [Trapelia coarctata]|nr:hypothetical protein [Trapelia coarctata]